MEGDVFQDNPKYALTGRSYLNMNLSISNHCRKVIIYTLQGCVAVVGPPPRAAKKHAMIIKKKGNEIKSKKVPINLKGAAGGYHIQIAYLCK